MIDHGSGGGGNLDEAAASKREGLREDYNSPKINNEELFS
jgi:hypothetical protein